MQYRILDGRLHFKVGDLTGALPRETSLALARAILSHESGLQRNVATEEPERLQEPQDHGHDHDDPK
jgi:hypothetical protein